jgi:hypothetical protein
MKPLSEFNPYYETSEFKNSFKELISISERYYEASRQKNANFEAFAEHLYSEVGHYIYELLQNADDANATEVLFKLDANSLEFCHNGTKYFTIENIAAICTYGGNDKSGEIESIGRFGVGFKSTSRITETPQIRSSQFAFQINHQVIPQHFDSDLLARKDFATHFRFPFGTAELNASSIYRESLSTLLKIDSNNLLFLNNIKLIVIELPNEKNKKRVLGKTHIDPLLVELKQSMDGTKNSVEVEYFLKYSRNLDAEKIEQWAKANNKLVQKNDHLRVSLAIKCDVSEEDGITKVSRVTALPEGQLFVFFPAKNERTGLKFHIHAPFSATTTRENIKDSNAVNTLLFDQFPQLTRDALIDLVDRKILNVEGLEILPNNGDEIRSELKPVQKTVYDFFCEAKPHVPLSKGGYSPLVSIREVSNEVGSLFSATDLQFLEDFNTSRNGKAENIEFTHRPKNVRSARFLSSISVTSFGLRDLVVAFSYINSSFALHSIEAMKRFSEWLGTRDLNWIKDFYLLLSVFDLERVGVYFKQTPIIRVNSQSVPFVTPSEAFISRNGEKTGPNFVDTEIIDFSLGRRLSPNDSQIMRFLESVGVRPFSKSMMLNEKINSYFDLIQSGEVSEMEPGPKIQQALSDLLEFVHGDVELERALHQKKIFLTESTTGELAWHTGSSIYIDAPFQPATGLDSVMSKLEGHKKKFRLWNGYTSIPNIVVMVERLGVTVGVVAGVANGSSSGEYSISTLREYLEFGDLTLRRNVWNYVKSSVANRDRHYLRFPNSHLNSLKELSDSAKILRDTAWIPDRTGILFKPAQIDRDKLNVGFIFDQCDYLDAIDFGADTQASLLARKEKQLEKQRKDDAARLLGASNSEELEMLIKAMKKNPGRFQKIIEELNRPAPSDHVANPLQTSERIAALLKEEPDVEMELVLGSQRQGSKELVMRRREFLKNTYQLDNVIYCQICSASSFIKATNGEPFFVAIMVITSFSKNSIFNTIAVCAQCHAKYKWGKKTTDLQLKNSILNHLDFSGTVHVDVLLGGEIQQIKFKESHFVNLRGALSVD